MKVLIIAGLITILFPRLALSQISGTVMDKSNNKPIPYVNVWIKNKLIGATTNEDGKFVIEDAKTGDTLTVSILGYNKVEFPTEKENKITLMSKVVELEEVVVIPMRNTTEFSIEPLRKIKKNRDWYNNGFYSLARFYEYKAVYKQTPFVKQINLITNNVKNENVTFGMRLVKVAQNGEPSEEGLSTNIIVVARQGVKETSIDLSGEKVLFPTTGLFVVVDRLNLEENKSFNKSAQVDILQPAIGMEGTGPEKNTWLGFGGGWIPPIETKQFVGINGNIATNIKLTN